MDETDAYRLDCIRADLLHSLDANHVVDYLIEKEVLNPDDDEEIEAETTRQRRMEKLLEILPGTTPDALEHLRGALQKDYGFIVQKLDAVQVPADSRANQPGAGGLQTAAAAAATAARGNPTTISNTTTRSVNVKGNDNVVIVGGHSTTINYHS